jgi:hypothetical protein
MSNANRDGSISAADIIAARALSQSWRASGIQAENFDPVLATAGTAPTTQKVFGDLFGFSAGQVVTGVVIRNVVAAAGSLPTTVRVGIADAQGNMLALSANLNALANWAAGPNLLPFTTPFTIPSDGGYYICFVVNGTWGTTQPTPIRVTGGVGASHKGIPNASPVSFEWATQTDLPAVGSALTLTTGNSVCYYLAVY